MCIITYLGATEFDFRVVGEGRSAIARYANNSNYRNDFLIRKESMFLCRSCFLFFFFFFRNNDWLLFLSGTAWLPFGRRKSVVCVSALLVKEIKRVIRESEIMKYVFFSFLYGFETRRWTYADLFFFPPLFCSIIGKMTRSGLEKIRMVDKNLRFG